jgi:ABC-type Fe3+-siderophore transport system permease subunit
VTPTLRRAVGLVIIGAVLPMVAAVRAATPSRISEIPAGAVMAILGGPYLVRVLRQRSTL